MFTLYNLGSDVELQVLDSTIVEYNCSNLHNISTSYAGSQIMWNNTQLIYIAVAIIQLSVVTFTSVFHIIQSIIYYRISKIRTIQSKSCCLCVIVATIYNYVKINV